MLKSFLLNTYFVDRKFHLARNWSNQELARFAPLFGGEVVNVSAWKDEDKQGGKYQEYFKNASTYRISNFHTEARGFQGLPNEFFLDLTDHLPKQYEMAFDCVFNHTTLEHIYDVKLAFENLCKLSRDAVVIVVPFLQQMHAEYGDYWRFTPTALARMFNDNGFVPIYTSYNNHLMASVYIFMIAVRDPKVWEFKLIHNSNANGEVPFGARPVIFDPFDHFVGVNAIPSFRSALVGKIRSIMKRREKDPASRSSRKD